VKRDVLFLVGSLQHIYEEATVQLLQTLIPENQEEMSIKGLSNIGQLNKESRSTGSLSLLLFL